MRNVILSLCLISGLIAKPEYGISVFGDHKYTENQTFNDVNPDAPKGGTIRMAVVGSYDCLNTALLKGQPAAGLELTRDALMFRSPDEPFAMYGLLAEKADLATDKSRITFYLNPKARWADSKPVTADDVVFTYNLYKEKGRANQRIVYKKVKTVRKLDNLTVEFTFDKIPDQDRYDPELPIIMAMMNVMPKHFWQDKDYESYSTKPILGSGPYRIKSFAPGRSIEYELRDDYWARDLPVNKGRYNFKTVKIDYYREKNVSLEAFKAGEYDVREETDPMIWQTKYNFPAVKDGRVKKIEVPLGIPAGCFGIALNQRNDILKDIRVRKALNLMFDFEWINKNLFNNGYERTDSFFVATEMASSGLPVGDELELLNQFKDRLQSEIFATEFKVFKTDGSGRQRKAQREAQKLLQQAGWTLKNGKLINAKGDQLSLNVIIDTPTHEKMLLAYKKSLAKVGVKLNIRLLDAAQYNRRAVDYDFDMLLFNWHHTYSPGREQLYYWSTDAANKPGTRNYNGIQHPVVDALCDRIAQAESRQEQLTSIRALDRVLKWGYYIVPLYHINKAFIAYKDKFGLPPFKDGMIRSFTTWWAKAESK